MAVSIVAADPMGRFQPAVREWLREAFAAPTRAQILGWPPIQDGRSTLILAPTGSGKTLAAFLAAIDRLMFAPPPRDLDRCRVVYVSPLRALAVDVERNLRAPIAGIARVAERNGERVHLPLVGVRTGDTSTSDRARMARHPPDVLITTPESLFLVLTSQAREMLRSVELVILDEIHTLVGSKRGAHLAISLERIEELAQRPIQRIGLSATQRPLDEVARYLGGYAQDQAPRPVEIVDASARKAFEITVEVPVEDMSRLGEVIVPTIDEIPEGPAAAVRQRSIWPAIYPRLIELIRAHRSTIVFVNSRRSAERVCAAINELAGAEIARAHHGSVAREQRVEIEDALKSGRLPCMVATSSLELGIDMGSVDLVIQIETPTSVASGIQRIGRAGHQVEGISRARIFPKFRGDLLATAAITRAIMDGKVEPVRIPRNPLDVLAQQLVAMCVNNERRVDDLYTLTRQAAPFADLPRAQFEGVLDMLTGRYPSGELADLRPRLVWDRVNGAVRARDGARQLVVANAGTIPDRGMYGVYLADDGKDGMRRKTPARRVGELDEEMVFETSEGEVVLLGASSWRVVEITNDRVLVAPAPGEPGKMPFWRGDRLARPIELGEAIGRLTRELANTAADVATRRLVEDHGLDAQAARNLLAYLDDQRAATGSIPDDRTIVIERSRDEMGDWRVCILSPWGGRVHAPWSLIIQAKLRAATEYEPEMLWTDDGIVVRFPDRGAPPDVAPLLPLPDEIESLVVREVGGSAMFAAHFRESAGRALLLPRRRPGQRTPLWMQRKRAHDLLHITSRFGSFPIVLETYRECLQEVFDLTALADLARKMQRREIRVVTVDTDCPSPYAAALMFTYVANFLYDGDQPLAERRAQALTVDQAQLRELLGEPDLRSLLDADAIAEIEQSLQALDDTHRARSVDRLHELLMRIGDLSHAEIAARCSGDADTWLARLLSERRVIAVQLGGEQRYAAVEDAGRLRDAFGVMPPAGVPAAFLEPAASALDMVCARYARCHGPFTSVELAGRFGMGAASIELVLGHLAAAGRLVEGEFRPGAVGREWCDADVLGRIRRLSLAKLRKQAEPAEPAALARLQLVWQGVVLGPRPGTRSPGPDRLLDVIEQLQGAVVPASVLERDVLSARLPGYSTRDLDDLCAAGEVVWVGAGSLGDRDGKLALYLAEDLPLLRTQPSDAPDGDLHRRIREHLASRGATFFHDLHAIVGGPQSMLLDALWDLAWAGEVTSDAMAAVRAFLGGSASTRRDRRRAGVAFRSRRMAPPSAVGRWSLLTVGGGASSTERARALADQLVARHGVLTRAAVAAEGVPGGFSALYPVLRALEEAGRIRRGYFVARQGGMQFAHPGAVDRLRMVRETAAEPEDDLPPAVVIAATDPANPYGLALAWPESPHVRLARTAGANVGLVDGHLSLYVARGERDVATFLPADEPDRSTGAQSLARAIAAWCATTGRLHLGWNTIDGLPCARSPLTRHLLDAGFTVAGGGFRLSRPPSPSNDA
jgi:ATP-dependent Lhr-like helicase